MALALVLFEDRLLKCRFILGREALPGASGLLVLDLHQYAGGLFGTQRFVEKFGEDPDYGWSEDKARQYSVPERADFGAFVRASDFKLD